MVPIQTILLRLKSEKQRVWEGILIEPQYIIFLLTRDVIVGSSVTEKILYARFEVSTTSSSIL